MKFRIAALLAIIVMAAHATIGASADDKAKQNGANPALTQETSEPVTSAEIANSQRDRAPNPDRLGKEPFQHFGWSGGSRF